MLSRGVAQHSTRSVDVFIILLCVRRRRAARRGAALLAVATAAPEATHGVNLTILSVAMVTDMHAMYVHFLGIVGVEYEMKRREAVSNAMVLSCREGEGDGIGRNDRCLHEG